MSLIYLWFTLVVANFYPLFDGGLAQIWQVIRGNKEVDAAGQAQNVSGVAYESESTREEPEKGGLKTNTSST